MSCPRRGDVDLDGCFGCNELVGFEQEMGAELLVCTGRRALFDQFHLWQSWR